MLSERQLELLSNLWVDWQNMTNQEDTEYNRGCLNGIYETLQILYDGYPTLDEWLHARELEFIKDRKR